MKYIKQWLRQYKKHYTHGSLWKDTLAQKEEKKVTVFQAVPVQNAVHDQIFIEPLAHTIFHQGKLGHNDEESQKIKQIYGELENIFSPQVLAV